MITSASNLILSRTSNKRSVSQNTVNTSFFFSFSTLYFFYRLDSSSHFVEIDYYEKFHTIVDSIFFVNVTEKIESELFEIFTDFVYFENASIKKRCTCVASVFKFWKKNDWKFWNFFFINCASFIIKWYETSEICHVYNRNATEKLNMITNHFLKMLKQRLIHIY